MIFKQLENIKIIHYPDLLRSIARLGVYEIFLASKKPVFFIQLVLIMHQL